jgi:malonate-semialdehyde dehydrogenase (acetylating)/methylmalonate-semialdehyde dehydrogenase
MSTSAPSQIEELRNYVEGEWRRPAAREYQDVINPATGETLARVPLSGASDVGVAVEAAAAAFPAWRRTPPEERIQYLFKLKMVLEEHIDDLARLTTMENGKTLAESRAELRRGIENVEVACGIPTMMQTWRRESTSL